MKAITAFLVGLAVASLFAGAAYAQTVTKPHNFTPGTPANAEEVNQNFDVLYQKINELTEKLNQVDGDGDGSNLIDDCDDTKPTVYPGATEECDGLDNDCNESVDEGIAATPSECGQGECYSTGEITCTGGQLVNSCQPGAPSPETCDGLDNDCIQGIDNGDPLTLCPSRPNTGSRTCFSGECSYTCANDYFDVDGDMENGCECLDDPSPNACPGATTAITVSVGSNDVINGVLIPDTVEPNHSSDWYKLHVPPAACGLPNGYFRITLAGPNAASFKFSLFTDCGLQALATCPAGGCIDMPEWVCNDYYYWIEDENGYPISCPIPYPTTILMRVDKVDGAPLGPCDDLAYQITIQR